MSRALAIGVLAVLAATFAGPSARAVTADDQRDAFRPCTRGDLIGTWAMIRLGTAPSVRVDESDPYFYPYQRYAFAADRSMHHLTATVPVGPAEQKAILSMPPTTTWTIDDQGRLLTRKTGATRPEVDACQILLTKVSDPRSPVPGLRGDLLLTHYGEDGKPIARRLLRKMSAPSE